jgi:acyl-CoA synthetase (AMP-forming)/AMP-acid ligase II
MGRRIVASDHARIGGCVDRAAYVERLAMRVPRRRSGSRHPTADTVAIGEQGELCTRGYLVMKGYDKEPEATARAIDTDGWLHTGDLATMRPDGYFRITGRLKDMIIRGGENIYPREVEEFLYTHRRSPTFRWWGCRMRSWARRWRVGSN